MSEETKKEVTVPEKFKSLVSEIEKMSVLDLSELVKVLEEKFGVSSAMPMMAASVVAAGGDNEEGSTAAKSTFNVELKSTGEQKIQVIKVLREATGFGLKEAKDLADAAPKVVKENASKEEAEELKGKLEAVGATVELK
ncbi:MAG: 50S ribosomal protein L7/L12 [Candidatus Ryanbacteria bacterium RIFCSPHIGHO2_02_FULL_45_13b]|uniref:Large ribosomal subunit protein bL12 n=1 Tax=Candidatus Ryanbacteria bacterium RIFCSPHIGHO2_02_FULL_45_13b TaxID=1802117 RepID=A0A1G2G7V8_9BACT|nr:MAG: 50S ribosomal protein L7/L12 [Candidatus Ryanbacteria bacterium RIFCSPHIGHO2_02_FULL_45_13b]